MVNEKLFGLPKGTIEQIIGVIKSCKKIEKIVLFGSRAKGNYKNGSDIDIALFSKELSFNDLLRIKVNLGELKTPFTIDIVDFNEISNIDLKEHILRVGKQLFVNEVS